MELQEVIQQVRDAVVPFHFARASQVALAASIILAGGRRVMYPVTVERVYADFDATGDQDTPSCMCTVYYEDEETQDEMLRRLKPVCEALAEDLNTTVHVWSKEDPVLRSETVGDGPLSGQTDPTWLGRGHMFPIGRLCGPEGDTQPIFDRIGVERLTLDGFAKIPEA